MKDRAVDIFDQIADAVIARQDPWRENAACRGVGADMFYPKQNQPMGHMQAKSVCAECTVTKECKAEWDSMPAAIQHHGVWWGTTDKERRAM